MIGDSTFLEICDWSSVFCCVESQKDKGEEGDVKSIITALVFSFFCWTNQAAAAAAAAAAASSSPTQLELARALFRIIYTLSKVGYNFLAVQSTTMPIPSIQKKLRRLFLGQKAVSHFFLPASATSNEVVVCDF